MDVTQLNNEIILTRKLVYKVRRFVIQKLQRQIHKLNTSRGNEEHTKKNQKRACKLSEEIKIIKSLKPDNIFKFAVRRSERSEEDNKLNADQEDTSELAAYSRLAASSLLQQKVLEFKEKYPIWKSVVNKSWAKSWTRSKKILLKKKCPPEENSNVEKENQLDSKKQKNLSEPKIQNERCISGSENSDEYETDMEDNTSGLDKYNSQEENDTNLQKSSQTLHNVQRNRSNSEMDVRVEIPNSFSERLNEKLNTVDNSAIEEGDNTNNYKRIKMTTASNILLEALNGEENTSGNTRIRKYKSTNGSEKTVEINAANNCVSSVKCTSNENKNSFNNSRIKRGEMAIMKVNLSEFRDDDVILKDDLPSDDESGILNEEEDFSFFLPMARETKSESDKTKVQLEQKKSLQVDKYGNPLNRQQRRALMRGEKITPYKRKNKNDHKSDVDERKIIGRFENSQQKFSQEKFSYPLKKSKEVVKEPSKKVTKEIVQPEILHPSWEAKRKLKEQATSLQAFQGKKIIFED